MQRFPGVVQDTAGNALASATVTVYNQGTLVKPAIYSDNARTVLANPFTVNPDGTFEFYAQDGRYDVNVVRTGFSFTTTTTYDAIVYDGPSLGVVNVKDYGAKGDGVTNDAAAFNTAITGAAASKVILVPQGSYVLNGALVGLSAASFLSFGSMTITGTNTDTIGHAISGNEELRFTAFGGATNMPAKMALMLKGTGQASGVRGAYRIYMNGSPGDNVNFEAHNDGDGNQRYRIATRIGGGGTHFPFYFQVGGFDTLYIDTTGVIVTRDKTGANDWQVAGAARGDLVLGANGNTIWAVKTTGTLYNIIGSDTSDRVRMDTNGGTVVAGTTPTVLTNAAGQLVTPAVGVGTYSGGATTPSVLNVSYMEITNGGATTITNFTNGRTGQIITLKFADGNTTVDRTNARLAGGVNFTSAANRILVLVLDSGGVWNEVSRATTNS